MLTTQAFSARTAVEFLVFFLMFCVSHSILALDGLENKVIPEKLHAWIPWVMKDDPEFGCPVIYNQNHKICAYPHALTLNINERNGNFSQSWDVYNKTWIPLPGDISNWPLRLMVNKQPQAIVERNGLPYVHLDKGHYQMGGQFQWYQQPKYMAVPQQTGLLQLMVDNQIIAAPDFRQGRLWFKSTESKQHKNNRLELHVFRKITDSIPLQVQTQIRIGVSGKQREIILDGALLKDFIPASLSSQLPAQLDSKGRLKIQARPGQWLIEIGSRYQKQTNDIALSAFTSPWPQDEIWVLENQPHLRHINVINKVSIDANQTQLPAKWKKYPAYHMQSEQKLVFEVIKRGDPEGEPDQLSLSKKIWLDFNGQGFTVNDSITGKISRQWRLNTASDIKLGQVTINGQPQYITYNADKNHRGVEVRHGDLKLSADSRIEEGVRTFSAGGWDVDFNSVKASLYLPAGWKIFSLSGVESSRTWIASWTLLDLFIVLLTAIAMYKLWGIMWGATGLLALVLVWHQAIAPQLIWINLIVAIALIRALPDSRFVRMIQRYRLLMSVVLVLILLPFTVDQARTALYPQLEFNNIDIADGSPSSPVLLESAPQAEVVADKVQGYGLSKSYSRSSLVKRKSITIAEPEMVSIDPDAMIQTGPGLPSWTLQEYHLRWDGPVKANQTMSMVLMSPQVNVLLNVLRIVLVILIAWRLIEFSTLTIPSITASRTVKLLLPILLVGLGFASHHSEAAFPSQELLDKLHKEISKAPECQLTCASIESMAVNLSSDNLTIELAVNVQSASSIPLPIAIKKWQPNRILVNEQLSSAVFRHNQQLWLHLDKGNHQVSIVGNINYLNHLQLEFPLKPHFIELNVSGWSSDGWDNDIKKINALSFSRIDTNKQSVISEHSDIPVHAEIIRKISLGVEWQVSTQLKVVSGTSYPALFKIPLLSGESVMTDGLKIHDGHVLVTLSKQQRSVAWTSKLDIAKQLELKALNSKFAIEQWVLNVSPMWSVSYTGIPVIYHQRSGSQWQPQWRPWPNEQVSMTISRPEGVKGRTMTIDSSKLEIQPGEQISTSTLAFNLRSSLGGQHIIRLPANAELQEVFINAKAVPIRQTEQGIPLPIKPGQQKIQLKWQEPEGIRSIYQVPVVDLGIDSVNNAISLQPGYNRWVLLTSGPKMGPAILFWGVFGVILLISYGLGRFKGLPLNTLQWILLWVGLSASQPETMVLIAGTLFALRKRSTMNTQQLSNVKFNLLQFALILLIVFSILSLVVSIQQGLLGSPAMQVTGNGSNAYQLNWFSDRIMAQTPEVVLWSVPVYIYRVMMLLWSIWLAFSFLKWVKWGWKSFTQDGVWRHIESRAKHRNKARKADKLTIDEGEISFDSK